MDVCHDSRRRDDEGGTDQAFDPVLCNAPLKNDQPNAKTLFDEWHSTVAYMSSHISPKSLELSVVCDIHHDDMEAARHVVDPIGLFPELRNCHIRLSRTSTPQLRRMAHDAVLGARRITGPSSSGNVPGVARSTQLEDTRQSQLRGASRLLALPHELRFHILTYTDLITPWRQVVFFSSNRFVVHGFRIFLPWSTPDDSTLEAQGEGEDETATEVTGVSEYHSDRLAASVFLREKVPPRMLRELRELEFVFPPYRHTGWPGKGHSALIDWAETLYWARDRMNLIGLKLRLVMADVLDLDGPPPGRGEIISEQVEEILSAYRRITSPLAVLSPTEAKYVDGSGWSSMNLRSFSAEVAWPWEWNWGFQDHYDKYGWDWVRDYRRDRRREGGEEAERLVMGQRYNEAYVSDPDPIWYTGSIWAARFRSYY